MKRLIIAAAAFAALGTAAQAQTVRLATEGAYAPWNFIDESGAAAGFEIDLGNEICSRAGLTCEWVITAWDTMIPNLLAGNYDVIMAGMSITEERLQSIDFSDEYYPPDPSLYAVREGAAVDFDAASGLRLGAQTGTIQEGYLQATFAGSNTIVSYATFDQAVADLIAGNLDAVLADAGYILPIVAAGQGLEIAGPEVSVGGGVGGGMRKEDDDLEAAFNAAIASMKADGSLNALITEWFDVPNTFD
ncbi:MAG: transporter substrate-binding domain-containing protein [Bauldia sp.]|nr:transporter substrate-binding domain-containing protein [Bauldia sp.]